MVQTENGRPAIDWQRSVGAIAGALVGGVLGHLAFVWLIGQGFYALILPGGLVGLGAGLARYGNLTIAILCAFIACAITIVSEWRVFPFVADESLPYFVTHLYQLKPLTLIMIVLGTVIGFWIPYRQPSPQ